MQQSSAPQLAGEPTLHLYHTIYIEPEDLWGDDPMVFQCWAEDAAHATEQCLDSYPDCAVFEVKLAA